MIRSVGNPLCGIEPDGSVGDPLHLLIVHEQVYAMFFDGFVRMTVHQETGPDGPRYWGETHPGEAVGMIGFFRCNDAGIWCCEQFVSKGIASLTNSVAFNRVRHEPSEPE